MTVSDTAEVTGFQAGMSGDEQIRFALQEIADQGGSAQMPELYAAVERRMGGKRLSAHGRASLRFFVNRVAVKAGYIYPHDPATPGWRITPGGRERLEEDIVHEEVVNLDTNEQTQELANSARGAALEQHVLGLLQNMYPQYSWYHQGRHKRLERGLDFIGSRLGEIRGEAQWIGVQVKFHGPSTAASDKEWLSFLAGCFARRVDHALFITTGRLTSEQRREAGEARVAVIEGRPEYERVSAGNGVAPFDLFEDEEPPEEPSE